MTAAQLMKMGNYIHVLYDINYKWLRAEYSDLFANYNRILNVFYENGTLDNAIILV